MVWIERGGLRRLLARPLILGAILLAAGACGSTPPTTQTSAPPVIAQPSGPPILGIDWGRAASVDRPDNFAVDPSEPPYTGMHPILRIPGQATLSDVIGLAHGGFVAIGYEPPAWVPAAWTSADGLNWAIHPMETTDFTFPVALATGADGTVVAVGRSGGLPVAWTTVDGVAWQRHAVAVLGSGGVAERMTAVVAGDRGFVAGGSVGPEVYERHARFWTSVDGTDWQPVPDDPAAFADAEVRSITRFSAGFVAVGVVGTAQQHSAAVAWTSSDGATWTRIDDPSFASAVAVAIATAPFGGLIAVGSDLDRTHAVAWTSPDAHRWTRLPSGEFGSHPYQWMTDVAAIGDTVVAVGDYQSGQRGTATSWISRDGTHWDQARTAPVQEQVELYAITPGGPGAIAVGSFGAPDSYVPGVWLSPAR